MMNNANRAPCICKSKSEKKYLAKMLKKREYKSEEVKFNVIRLKR
jgi:hypothetical protein